MVINEDGYTSSIQEKILSITVKPGWNDGTRVTFPEQRDQGPNSVPADIVFIVINEDGYTSSIQEKILSITVKPGWNDGTRVTFPEEEDQGPNSVPADIVFIVRQKTHPWFTRQQNNLVYRAPISLGLVN
ncbi:hypothetical protein NHX12_010558 [Muraenolepis orangiensis]|uniref:Chaperone DnaJ C-terminal domain-containing protein n=1 Tax=Muraenolepis orangiensis TaxID=630683 RepID=A0A9Q0DMH2_9TELE|nr:hypothetical protein NHX12_010558 [Muraenolepis orangiensis]